jgi:hypothetical protein
MFLINRIEVSSIDRSWEADYAKYLDEKESYEKSTINLQQQQPAKENDINQTWEEQYAAYCAEKEAKLRLLDDDEQQERQK